MCTPGVGNLGDCLRILPASVRYSMGKKFDFLILSHFGKWEKGSCDWGDGKGEHRGWDDTWSTGALSR